MSLLSLPYPISPSRLLPHPTYRFYFGLFAKPHASKAAALKNRPKSGLPVPNLGARHYYPPIRRRRPIPARKSIAKSIAIVLSPEHHSPTHICPFHHAEHETRRPPPPPPLPPAGHLLFPLRPNFIPLHTPHIRHPSPRRTNSPSLQLPRQVPPERARRLQPRAEPSSRLPAR